MADICAQVVINQRIRQAFPGDCIIGEEDSTECSDELFASVSQHIPSLSSKAHLQSILQSPQPDSSSTRYWTVDPIDGTKGFIRGDQYAICIALVDAKDQKSVLAVLGCPNFNGGKVLVALKGFGIYQANLGQEFSEIVQQENFKICESLKTAQFIGAFESAHTKATEIADIMAACANSLPLIKMDSQCKYAALAVGLAHVYYRRHASENRAILNEAAYTEAIWDNAPGAIFVEEAGGQCTDFAGIQLTFPPTKHFKVVGGIVASMLTPELHSQLVSIIRDLLK